MDETATVESSLLKLPMAKIKTIAKIDQETQVTSQEAIFLLAKATELFIELLAQEGCKEMEKVKKKILSKSDLMDSLDKIDGLAFLQSGILDMSNESILKGGSQE